MLIRLTVRAIASPSLIVQRNGAVDKIQCRQLEVVDENGNKAIELLSKSANFVLVYDKKERVAKEHLAVVLASVPGGNWVFVRNKPGSPAITFNNASSGNWVEVYDRQGGEAVILLSSERVRNRVRVKDNQTGELKELASRD